MYRFHHGFILLVLLVCTLPVKSEEVEAAKNTSTHKEDGWTLSVERYNESYKEKFNNKPFMREDASMFGLILSRKFQGASPFFMVYSARVAFGDSDYTGAYQGKEYGSLKSNGQSRSVLDMRLTGHYTTNIKTSWTPYAGLGFRFLGDDLHESSGGGGYKRESEYIYTILGMSSRIAFDQVRFDPYVQYHYLAFGKQSSYLNGENNAPLEHKQHHGYGVEMGVPVVFGHRDQWDMTFFYRYWHIGDSEEKYINNGRVVTSEPDNKTKEIGVKVGYRF